MNDTSGRYEGTELELFAEARTWKRYVASQLQPFIGDRVLEVGAGMGTTTESLCAGLHRTWVCLEPDAALVGALEARIARRALPAFCEARRGTLADVARDERFDTILYIDVLEHIAQDREEVAQAAAHLDRAGRLVVLAPAHQALFSEFDRSIGHYRRYDRTSLLALAPPNTRTVIARYLDCAGLLASLANRWLLRQSMPTAAQIRTWDRRLVPCSRALDAVLGYALGKTVVAVWERA